jgi:DNA-binding transcriptional LysR family regulator
MTLNDLRLFAAAARHASLVLAAESCHVTPSAMSRAIQRLEADLRAPLFDRVGKGLTLNQAGVRLQQHALDVLALIEQTRSEFAGSGFRVQCRVAAPPLLQRLFGTALAAALTDRYPDSSITFESAFEKDAAHAVAQGAADFALVTDEVLQQNGGIAALGLEAVRLCEFTMHLAMSRAHPLAGPARQRPSVTAAALAEHDFACPTRSLFCGLKRGVGSDGWHDDALTRRIRYWVDDLQVLIELVQAGRALAYLPDRLVEASGLLRATVSDCPFTCQETVSLLWRPTSASGWQRAVVDALALTFGASDALPMTSAADPVLLKSPD